MSDQTYRYLRITIDVVVFDDEDGKKFVDGEAIGSDLEDLIKSGDIEIDGINEVEVH